MEKWKNFLTACKTVSKDSNEAESKNGMLFIEDINGTPVLKNDCTIICKLVYNMWINWAKKGLAADQWGTVGENLKAKFQKEMIKAFLVIGMSALGWKINKLATQYYSV